MLRESVQISGETVDLRGVTAGFGDDAKSEVTVAHAPLLTGFAEAVVRRDDAAAALARDEIARAMGAAALVDAAAIVAAFHGFTRVADTIGIPYETAAQGRDAPEIREQAGINTFYRISGGPPG